MAKEYQYTYPRNEQMPQYRKKGVVEPKLGLASHQLLLSGLGSDSSLRGKFNDNGKSDTCFWIAGTGRDTNHLITESEEAARASVMISTWENFSKGVLFL